MSTLCASSGHSFQEHSKTSFIFCTRCGDCRGMGISEVGIIVMWSGTLKTVPKGWSLCDGSHGTPDLRDRFVIGAGGAHEPFKKGGASVYTLETNNIPAHNHNKNAGGKEEVPIIVTKVQPGENIASVVSTHSFSQPKDKCSVVDCRDFPRCVDRYRYYGHSRVAIKDPAVVYARPARYLTTGDAGSADPTPVDTVPPFFALAFIMRISEST